MKKESSIGDRLFLIGHNGNWEAGIGRPNHAPIRFVRLGRDCGRAITGRTIHDDRMADMRRTVGWWFYTPPTNRPEWS